MIGQITISDGAAVLVAIATFILAFVTYLNVRETTKLVKETHLNVRETTKLVEMQVEPFVYIETRWVETVGKEAMSKTDWHLWIYLKNSGGGQARDVNFIDVKDDFPIIPMYSNIGFKQVPVIKEGIKELAPHQEHLLAWMSVDCVSTIGRSVEVVFEYKNVRGKPKSGSSILDFPRLLESRI